MVLYKLEKKTGLNTRTPEDASFRNMQKRSLVSHSFFLHPAGAGGGEALGTRRDNATEGGARTIV